MQPEHTVESVLNELKAPDNSGIKAKLKAPEKLTETSKNKLYSDLTNRLSEMSDFTVRLNSESYSDGTVSYVVLDGTNPVLDVTLKSTGSKSLMGMLTADFWEVLNIEYIAPYSLYSYDITLPGSFILLENGVKLSGEEKDGKTAYVFESVFDKLEMENGFGQKAEYSAGEEINMSDLKITVPENYTVTFAGKNVSETAEKADNPEYEFVKDFADFPKLMKIKLTGLLSKDDLVILDNLGNPVSFDKNAEVIEITRQAGDKDIPESILKEVDPLAMAKTWSLFMSDDLSGEKHGFSEVKKILIPDSYLYEMAYEWATSIDITFTTYHYAPVISEEAVTNFVKYSDRLFSCDIGFVKEMFLYDYGRTKVDRFNSTCYFLKQDGKWSLVLLEDIRDLSRTEND